MLCKKNWLLLNYIWGKIFWSAVAILHHVIDTEEHAASINHK